MKTLTIIQCQMSNNDFTVINKKRTSPLELFSQVDLISLKALVKSTRS